MGAEKETVFTDVLHENIKRNRILFLECDNITILNKQPVFI